MSYLKCWCFCMKYIRSTVLVRLVLSGDLACFMFEVTNIAIAHEDISLFLLGLNVWIKGLHNMIKILIEFSQLDAKCEAVCFKFIYFLNFYIDLMYNLIFFICFEFSLYTQSVQNNFHTNILLDWHFYHLINYMMWW